MNNLKLIIFILVSIHVFSQSCAKKLQDQLWLSTQGDLVFKNGFENFVRLNDTGINYGIDYPSGINATCTSNLSVPQDCDYGRDNTHNDDSDGHAGFSYTKLDGSGNELDVSALSWSCVRDNITGLIWEVKTTDGGIHDMDNQYQWGGITHIGNQGTIFFSSWDSLVNGSNNNTFCGLSNWHVASYDELISIVDYGMPAGSASIDSNYFPNTAKSHFWTASPYSNREDNAWIVGFNIGLVTDFARFNSGRVRLVSSNIQ